MPTPPKSVDVRFNNEAQIIAAIDKTIAKVEKLRMDASKLERKADEIYWGLRTEDGHAAYSPKAQDYRERAEIKRTKAEHIRINYLHRLKNKLAVMRTEILPGIVGDRTIPQ